MEENLLDLTQISEDNSTNKNPTNAKVTNGSLTSWWLFKFFAVFGFCFTCFIFVFQVVLTPVQIIGLSMCPTLNASATSDYDTTHTDIVYILKKSSYKNDDIVVIQNTDKKYIPNSDEVSSVIKRVIATEGQTIVFFPIETGSETSRTYYYDFKVLDENGDEISLDSSFKPEEMYFTYSVDFESYNTSNMRTYYIFYYNLCEQLKAIADNPEAESTKNVSYTVPKNQCFVMGDNRNHSTDSRYFGFVDNSDIMGSVQLHMAYGDTIWKSIWNKLKTIF